MPTQNPPKIDQKALVWEDITAAHFTINRLRRQTIVSQFSQPADGGARQNRILGGDA
jgi:hypothetical protein